QYQDDRRSTATLEISVREYPQISQTLKCLEQVDHCFGSLDASTGVALHRRELFLSNSGSGQPDELLEQRYKTYMTSSDIFFFASYGVSTLHVPISYRAFLKAVNGDIYHTGGQLEALAYVSQYAISKGMHIIVDLLGG
ncbi:hypothetical protein KCU67_g17387, partial [Aureobasidium melanogenum]